MSYGRELLRTPRILAILVVSFVICLGFVGFFFFVLLSAIVIEIKIGEVNNGWVGDGVIMV